MENHPIPWLSNAYRVSSLPLRVPPNTYERRGVRRQWDLDGSKLRMLEPVDARRVGPTGVEGRPSSRGREVVHDEDAAGSQQPGGIGRRGTVLALAAAVEDEEIEGREIVKSRPFGSFDGDAGIVGEQFSGYGDSGGLALDAHSAGRGAHSGGQPREADTAAGA